MLYENWSHLLLAPVKLQHGKKLLVLFCKRNSNFLKHEHLLSIKHIDYFMTKRTFGKSVSPRRRSTSISTFIRTSDRGCFFSCSGRFLIHLIQDAESIETELQHRRCSTCGRIGPGASRRSGGHPYPSKYKLHRKTHVVAKQTVTREIVLLFGQDGSHGLEKLLNTHVCFPPRS